MLELEKQTSAFDPEIYLQKGESIAGPESLWQNIEVFYQTRLDMIRGTMTFKMDHLTFEAYTRKDQDSKDTN